MEIEYYHDQEIFFKKCELHWKISTKDNLWRLKLYLYFGISFLILTVVFIIYKSYFSLVVGTASLFILYIYSYYKRKIQNAKEDYFKEIENVSKEYQADKSPISFKIYDQEFQYHDFKQSIKWKWSEIIGYYIIEDTVFLMIGKSINDALTVSKDEIGEERFKYFIGILKEKLK